jgi:tRNA dimethylallyltransferase
MTEPLIAIIGPTASGKTALGLDVAERYGGEIICADSRTIYRGMNIGTAKPTAEEQKRVRHHLLDIRNPDETYSAAEFKRDAQATIADIRSRGKLPIIVGGTGLYVWAVLYDYQFPAGASNQLRRQLQTWPIEKLVRRLIEVDPERAGEIDLMNPRRVIRAIETAGQPRSSQAQLLAGSLLVGLNPDMEKLEDRILARVEAMMMNGLIVEVAGLCARYGRDCQPFQTVGYEEMIDCLDANIDMDMAAKLIAMHTRQLAKRQMTWFKRNPDIQWCQDPDPAKQLIAEFLGHKV